MNSRNVAVAPMLLAAFLQAQEPPVPQGPTPQQKLEQLQREKQRLQKEIQFAKQRVDNAGSLLNNKLRRGKPSFRSIDAGKPRGMLSTAPKRVERKAARIGTPEEMKVGGGDAVVVVNRRGIGQKIYDDLSQYLLSYSPQANPDLIAQRVFYDLIRIEGVAGKLVDSEGRMKLGQALPKLEGGEMTVAQAAQKFGTVQGASAEGALEVTRNSVHGPLFEYVAFTTPVGSMARPFLSPRGYVVLKVDELKKGEQTALDKVACTVALFKFVEDDRQLMDAQYQVTSGQAEVLVRDLDVMMKLPALYRPQSMRQTPQQMLQSQLQTLEGQLAKLDAGGQGESERATELRAQIASVKARIQTLRDAAGNKGSSDADRPDSDGAPQVKKAPDVLKPAGGGN
ncbi:MAG: peptidylprolyl isomerase [Planctomycetota bacterium]